MSRQYFCEDIREILDNLGCPEDGRLQPFETGSTLRGSLVITDEDLPHEGLELELDGLTVTGDCHLENLVVVSLSLHMTGVRGDLTFKNVQARNVDLCGLRVKDFLDLSGLEADSIVCTADQAFWVHAAAPNIPLIIHGIWPDTSDESLTPVA